MENQKYSDAELKLAKTEMNAFLSIPCNEVIEWLESHKVVQNQTGADKILNAIIDQLVINFKEKHLL